jgi:hypothetical protein
MKGPTGLLRNQTRCRGQPDCCATKHPVGAKGLPSPPVLGGDGSGGSGVRGQRVLTGLLHLFAFSRHPPWCETTATTATARDDCNDPRRLHKPEMTETPETIDPRWAGQSSAHSLVSPIGAR